MTQKRALIGWNLAHAVIGVLALVLNAQRVVSDCYFYLGMALVCCGCVALLARAALFAGWQWRKPGEKVSDFKRRIKTPHEVTNAKNRPIKLSPRAKMLFGGGLCSVLWAIIITL